MNKKIPYGRITNKVMELTHVNGERLNRTDKFLLYTLIVKANKDGVATVANPLLASISDLSLRTIERSIKKLKKLEVIQSPKKGKYIINDKYLYKKGEGFGIVKWKILTSDLSINAKSLFIVNSIACGRNAVG